MALTYTRNLGVTYARLGFSPPRFRPFLLFPSQGCTKYGFRLFSVMGSSSSSSQTPDSVQEADMSKDARKVEYSSLSDEEWKKRLTKDQYYIYRQKGTERAFTGEYWNTKAPGTYHCVCCDTPLFE